MSVEGVLPHSLEAEVAILGAALVDVGAWPLVRSLLNGADFFRQAHRLLFVAMGRLADQGVAIDLLTLVEDLRRRGDLDEVGGPAYIASLVDGMPHSSNVEHYAIIVREKARLRALIHEAAALTAGAYEAAESADALLDRAVGRLLGQAMAGRDGATRAGLAVQQYAQALASDTVAEPIRTGYADLDDLSGGFRPGELVVVAARPGVGKSSWALGAAVHMARAGCPVLFATLETTVPFLAARLMAWESGVPVATIEGRAATDAQYAAVGESLGRLDGVPLVFAESARMPSQVTALARRMRQDAGLGCVVVDYLQLLVSGERQSSLEAETAALSRALKRLATDLRVVVIALSQLSRAPEARRDKRPYLSDLRGSGALEQDADVVILLFRPELYKRTAENDGLAEVIVAKHKTGPTGVVRLRFDRELARFSNLTVREEGT